MSDQMSENMPDSKSYTVSDRMRSKMWKYMSNSMSYAMSDRMPRKDVRLIVRINVKRSVRTYIGVL